MPSDLREKLESFTRLQEGWDTYGAAPIAALPIALARLLIEPPHLVPTSKGGVQLEWHAQGFDIEIEIHPSGRVAVYVAKGEEVLEGHVEFCDKCQRYFDVRSGCEADIRSDERMRTQVSSLTLDELRRDSVPVEDIEDAVK